MRKINLIVVHCSDSDVPNHDNVETINEWHKQRGFDGIGYHYFITKDGTVHTGRPEHVVGAHVRGFNSRSIGVCLSGRNEFTERQFESLERLGVELIKKYGLDKLDVLAHNELDKNKTCPNFSVKEKAARWKIT